MGLSDSNGDLTGENHPYQRTKVEMTLDGHTTALQQVSQRVYQTLTNISRIAINHTSLDNFFVSTQQEISRFNKNGHFSIALFPKKILLDANQQASKGNKLLSHFTVNSLKGIALNKLELRELDKNLLDLILTVKNPVLIKNHQVFSLSDNGELYQFSDIQLPDSKKENCIFFPLFEQECVLGIACISYSMVTNNYHDYENLMFAGMLSHHISLALYNNSLRNKIQANNDKLEKKIHERTQALQSTNLNLKMQIDERLKAEARLYYDAHHDALTQLPNRAMFSDRLSYAIKQLKRHPNNRFAVLFIDLDRFKMINDTLGHHAGDLFLIEISNRLQECVRENDVLARLGGDEFVVLVDALQSTDDIEEICLRIIQSISQPYDFEGQLLYSNASIGVAQSRLSYNHASEIIRDADAAMYQAKHLGRGRYVFFDDSMREQLIANMTLEQELRLAIKQQQFELHYQKISDLFLNDTLGFEVLLRWNHPTKGILSPSEFLYMAEETGMILDIENWVIKEVCLQLYRWNESDEFNRAYVAINMSGRHLIQPNQLVELINEIKKNTIEPERLILEFNEEALIRHKELALKGLLKLKEFGVKLALDDYGTAKSSFNLLHSSPFEFIKLDRSFIKTLNYNDKNLLLVKTLQDLGNNFGYRLVAEGIESEEMLKKLKSVGCEFGQGFHISYPKKLELQHEKSNQLNKKASA